MSPVRVYLLHQEDLLPPTRGSYPPRSSLGTSVCGHLAPPTHRPHCNSRAGAWGRPGDPWDPLGVPGWDRGGGLRSAGPASGPGTSGRAAPKTAARVQLQPGGSLSLPGSLRARPPQAWRPLTILQMEAMFRTVISLKVAAIGHRHLYQGKTGLSMVARSEAGWRRGGLGPACSGVGRARPGGGEGGAAARGGEWRSDAAGATAGGRRSWEPGGAEPGPPPLRSRRPPGLVRPTRLEAVLAPQP